MIFLFLISTLILLCSENIFLYDMKPFKCIVTSFVALNILINVSCAFESNTYSAAVELNVLFISINSNLVVFKSLISLLIFCLFIYQLLRKGALKFSTTIMDLSISFYFTFFKLSY